MKERLVVVTVNERLAADLAWNAPMVQPESTEESKRQKTALAGGAVVASDVFERSIRGLDLCAGCSPSLASDGARVELNQTLAAGVADAGLKIRFILIAWSERLPGILSRCSSKLR